MPLGHRVEHGGYVGGIGMLIEHTKTQAVDIYRRITAFEKAARRAQIFNYEILYGSRYLYVSLGHNGCRSYVAQRHRKKIKSRAASPVDFLIHNTKIQSFFFALLLS